MKTLSFSESYSDETIRRIAKRMDFVSKNIEECKTFISKSTDISKLQNWERMNASTAQGGNTLIDNFAHYGNYFDGRYIYYAAQNVNTFLRFDTTQSFTNSNAWERMSKSTSFGSSLFGGYVDMFFDGRYIYYTPYYDTFLRFDTTQSFTNSNAWEKMSTSTVQGGSALNLCYYGISFDGRYIYYCPSYSDTFLRFDTMLSFTNSSAWEKMNMSTAQEAATLDDSYRGSCFDGRYIYYGCTASNTFLRFDTTQPFTNSSAWERMSMSTVQGQSVLVSNSYGFSIFDGRYIYFSSRQSGIFLRFDAAQSFTNSSAWEKMSVSTVYGISLSGSLHMSAFFDGRYIYYSPNGSYTFLRFDTTQSFTNSNAWEKIAMSTAQGGSALNYAYFGISFDGKYIYFSPSNSITFLRVKTCSL